jgi:hypothetical protein
MSSRLGDAPVAHLCGAVTSFRVVFPLLSSFPVVFPLLSTPIRRGTRLAAAHTTNTTLCSDDILVPHAELLHPFSSLAQRRCPP